MFADVCRLNAMAHFARRRGEGGASKFLNWFRILSSSQSNRQVNQTLSTMFIQGTCFREALNGQQTPNMKEWCKRPWLFSMLKELDDVSCTIRIFSNNVFQFLSTW